jgi:hypothetical protein
MGSSPRTQFHNRSASSFSVIPVAATCSSPSSALGISSVVGETPSATDKLNKSSRLTRRSPSSMRRIPTGLTVQSQNSLPLGRASLCRGECPPAHRRSAPRCPGVSNHDMEKPPRRFSEAGTHHQSLIQSRGAVDIMTPGLTTGEVPEAGWRHDAARRDRGLARVLSSATTQASGGSIAIVGTADAATVGHPSRPRRSPSRDRPVSGGAKPTMISWPEMQWCCG